MCLIRFIFFLMFEQFVRLSITKVNRTHPLDKPFPGALTWTRNDSNNTNVIHVNKPENKLLLLFIIIITLQLKHFSDFFLLGQPSFILSLVILEEFFLPSLEPNPIPGQQALIQVSSCHRRSSHLQRINYSRDKTTYWRIHTGIQNILAH